MSSVPPNLVGPILQTPLTQRQVSAVRDAKQSHEAAAARQQTAASEDTDTIVETSDNDTRVHADAEGTGSQGRAYSESPESEEPPPPVDRPPPDDDTGRLIDLEA